MLSVANKRFMLSVIMLNVIMLSVVMLIRGAAKGISILARLQPKVELIITNTPAYIQNILMAQMFYRTGTIVINFIRAQLMAATK
jgi:hypothetical protein